MYRQFIAEIRHWMIDAFVNLSDSFPVNAALETIHNSINYELDFTTFLGCDCLI